MTSNTLVDYDGAANILGLCGSTVRCLVAQKKIPHLRLAPRLVRFDKAELEAWLDSRRVPAIVVANDNSQPGGT